MTLSTSLLVCGKFHYFNYVEALARKGNLHQFIFSHRLGTHKRFSGKFGTRNLWLKEYLYQAHYRLFGVRGLPLFYHTVWDCAARHALQPCDLLHFLMHGNCVRTLRRAKVQGALLLAEAVNSHPEDYNRIICEELDRLGITRRREAPVNSAAMEAERQMADFVLVPSRFVQESYERHGLSADQIFQLPYGANLNEFRPGTDKGKIFKVVCMAQVSARKGHYYLLQAWKKLRLKDAELHCYGYWDREVLEALQRLKVPAVHFHGSVPKPEVIAALQSASLAVLPTVEDGFGVVILEAMAAGLPVVTTTHSGGSEVIKDGAEGFVILPRDVESLAERILYFYQNRELTVEMGRAARRKVESGWGWDSYADRLVEIYRKVMAAT